MLENKKQTAQSVDDQLFAALQRNKRRRLRIWLTAGGITLAILLLIGMAVHSLRRRVDEKFNAGASDVLSYTASTGSISTTVSGTGKIETIVGAYTDKRTAPTSGGGSSGSGGGSDMPAYVYALMNIPYGEFYAAEGAADAVSSATRNGKARNVNVNGASYHESADAVMTEGIAGVMYPVRTTASQLDALKKLGAVAVTDSTEPVS